MRDANADSNTATGSFGKTSSGLEQRLWVEQDMNNWNVVGITDNTGAVVEHYRYDPYGSVHIFDGSWNSKTQSGYNWNYLFQGGRLDLMGLYIFQHRDYDPTTGRWIEQDPAGYVDGSSLYQFVQSNPVTKVDPEGLCASSLRAVAGGKGGIPSGSGNSSCSVPISINKCQHECDQVAKKAKGKVPPGIITLYLRKCYKCCGLKRNNSKCPFIRAITKSCGW